MVRFLVVVLTLCATADAQPTRIDPLAEVAPRAGLDDGDAFGRAVAVEGEWAVVGARRGACRAGAVGSAFVYRRATDGWVLDAELRIEEADAACGFGAFVAVGDGRVAVLATGTGPTGTGSAVVLFDRGSGGWAESGRVDLSAWGPSVRPVAVGPARLFAEAPGIGGVLVFEPVGGAWERTTTLGAPGWDAPVEAVAAGDRVAMRGTAVEGDARHSEVAVFEHVDGAWTEAFRARYPGGEEARTLALGDDHLVVVQAAPFGAVTARAYVREPTGWADRKSVV